MPTLARYEADQDRAEAEAHAAEATQRPTRQERADLIALADRCEKKALETADYWSAVRAAALTGGPIPKAPGGNVTIDHAVLAALQDIRAAAAHLIDASDDWEAAVDVEAALRRYVDAYGASQRRGAAA